MFSDFLPILKRSEGGYANVPADRGGETYAGITRKNYPTWAGWSIVDAAKPKQNQIIVNPKLDILIAEFYKKNFWDFLQCDRFSKYVGMNLCDFAVGSGVVTAARAFQKVINSLLPTGAMTLVVDGKIGEKTIVAANKLNQQKLNDELLAYRKRFYQTIVDRNPTQRQFLRSWTNRLVNFKFIEEIKKKVNVNYVLIGGAILALLLVLKYKK
jgi:lysozyme family protein